ncbi:MAG TPA: hypothetical protein VFG76_07760 [Candidatus Polarisedimenticolia bacterium]|nr:hypothetical protein [Candidatus Polarisedimenticolia bacterium]
MAERPPSIPAHFQLKAQASGTGALDPRTALLLWGAGSILLGLTVSFLLVRGEIRLIVMLLLGVLGLACLSPRRGVYILTLLLPFLYYLRRLVLNFQAFEQRDPILIFPALTAVAMFMGVAIFHGPLIFHYLKRSTLLKVCVVLMGWFLIEIINPLQGGPLVGIAGAMFFIVPMLWCFFGLLMTRKDLGRILKIVLAIGLVTALYGLKQHYFGMTDIEIYELKSKQFYKTFGGSSTVRVMSTFSSPGDFSQYLMVAGFITFAYFWRHKKNLMLALIVGLNLWAMLWVAVRTSFLLLMFSILILLALSGRNAMQIKLRGVGALLAITIAYGVLYQYDPQEMYTTEFSDNPYVVHTLSGITHPTEEKSLWMRFRNWGFIVSSTITSDPVGRGLGSTTTAAKRFTGGQAFEADSYFFELFYGSGILAPVLFAIIALQTLRSLLKKCLEEPNAFDYKLCLGLMSGIFLGSVFGQAARDTISGPLAWLIIGWTVRQTVEHAPGAAPDLEAAG